MPIFPTLQQNTPGQAPSGAGLTDDQIAQLRLYANTLQGNRQPVHHWLQGVSNMTKDIVGALEQRKADQAHPQRQAEFDRHVQPYLQPQTQGAGYGAVPPVVAPSPQRAGEMPLYSKPNTDWSNPQPTPYVGQTGDFDPSNMSTG